MPPAAPRDLSSPARRETRGRRILFASSSSGHSPALLRRLATLAAQTGSSVAALRLVSPPLRSGRAAGPAPEIAGPLELALDLGMRMAGAVPLDGAPSAVHVRRDEIGECVADHAQAIAAWLVAVPGSDGLEGEVVSEISTATGLPVLVLRPATGSRELVAASDLDHERTPVLRQAARIAQHLQAGLTFLHVMRPAIIPPLGGVIDFGLSRELELTARMQTVRERRLRQIAERLGAEARPVVVSHESPPCAILEVARERNADVILLGARRRPWWRRLVSQSTTAWLAQSAQRSVMLVPLDGMALDVD